jgi:hypothetical protein
MIRGKFIAAEEAMALVPEGPGREMSTMMLPEWVHWEVRADQQRTNKGVTISSGEANASSSFFINSNKSIRATFYEK